MAEIGPQKWLRNGLCLIVVFLFSHLRLVRSSSLFQKEVDTTGRHLEECETSCDNCCLDDGTCGSFFECNQTATIIFCILGVIIVFTFAYLTYSKLRNKSSKKGGRSASQVGPQELDESQQSPPNNQIVKVEGRTKDGSESHDDLESSQQELLRGDDIEHIHKGVNNTHDTTAGTINNSVSTVSTNRRRSLKENHSKKSSVKNGKLQDITERPSAMRSMNPSEDVEVDMKSPSKLKRGGSSAVFKGSSIGTRDNSRQRHRRNEVSIGSFNPDTNEVVLNRHGLSSENEGVQNDGQGNSMMELSQMVKEIETFESMSPLLDGEGDAFMEKFEDQENPLEGRAVSKDALRLPLHMLGRVEEKSHRKGQSTASGLEPTTFLTTTKNELDEAMIKYSEASRSQQLSERLAEGELMFNEIYQDPDLRDLDESIDLVSKQTKLKEKSDTKDAVPSEDRSRNSTQEFDFNRVRKKAEGNWVMVDDNHEDFPIRAQDSIDGDIQNLSMLSSDHGLRPVDLHPKGYSEKVARDVLPNDRSISQSMHHRNDKLLSSAAGRTDEDLDSFIQNLPSFSDTLDRKRAFEMESQRSDAKANEVVSRLSTFHGIDEEVKRMEQSGDSFYDGLQAAENSNRDHVQEITVPDQKLARPDSGRPSVDISMLLNQSNVDMGRIQNSSDDHQFGDQQQNEHVEQRMDSAGLDHSALSDAFKLPDVKKRATPNLVHGFDQIAIDGDDVVRGDVGRNG